MQRKNQIKPIIHGGGQEFGLRSGTENVPGIVGFGKAVEIAAAEKKSENILSACRHYKNAALIILSLVFTICSRKVCIDSGLISCSYERI